MSQISKKFSCFNSLSLRKRQSTVFPKIKAGFVSLVLALGLIFSQMAGATIFQPGETLTPDCAPETPNCGVAVLSINGQSGATQTLVTGSTGTDFSISSSGNIHSFYLPSASSLARGLLTASDWDTFNNKAAVNQTMYIGTTAVTINRASGALALTGITSIDGSAATVTGLSVV